MRAFLSAFVAVFLLPGTGIGAPPAEGTPLVTKLHHYIPPRMFELLSGAGAAPEPGRIARQMPAGIKRLPDQPNGAPRYNVLPFVLTQGVTPRPGQAAIYPPSERALVFTGSAEDQDLIKGLFEIMCGDGFGPIRSLEISVSTWTYLDDARVPASAHMENGIRARAKKCLRTRERGPKQNEKCPGTRVRGIFRNERFLVPRRWHVF